MSVTYAFRFPSWKMGSRWRADRSGGCQVLLKGRQRRYSPSSSCGAVDAPFEGSMQVERCVSCRFYDRNHRGGEAKSANAGQCRKAAPALSPINQKTYMIEGVWPTVRDDDWCGEWKALQRRPESSRLSDVLNGAQPSSMPMPPGMPPAMPPSAFGGTSASMPRVSAQVARAALSSFGIESRPPAPSPELNLGTGNS